MYTEKLDWCSVMDERGGMGRCWRQAQEAGDVCNLIDDSHCSKAENNVTL